MKTKRIKLTQHWSDWDAGAVLELEAAKADRVIAKYGAVEYTKADERTEAKAKAEAEAKAKAKAKAEAEAEAKAKAVETADAPAAAEQAVVTPQAAVKGRKDR